MSLIQQVVDREQAKKVQAANEERIRSNNALLQQYGTPVIPQEGLASKLAISTKALGLSGIPSGGIRG